MKTPGPVLTAHLFRPLHDELVTLLKGLTAAEWSLPTVAGAWTVKDVAAHLLDTTMRRVATLRDEWMPPLPENAFAAGLGTFVHRLNRDWVSVAARFSPRMLVELHELYGPALADAMEALDPYGTAPLPVSWAGEEESPAWFDVARELTEKWHHQQQIRDAAGRRPLYDGFLAPVIETFMRALPFAYRGVAAPEGTAIVVCVDDAVWSLVRHDTWTLYGDEAPGPAARITLTGDAAWRLFTRQKIDPRAQIAGDQRYAAPLLAMTTIVA